MRYFNFKIGFILFLLVLFFVFVNITGFSRTVKNFFYSISSPIEKTLWQKGIDVSDFFEGIFRAGNLKKENTELRLQNSRLLGQLAVVEEIKKENTILREALNLNLEKEFKLMFSQIVLKDTSKDSLLINKGLKDGVKKGMPAITGQKALLGRVGEVYDNFAEIILISSKESSFDAIISRPVSPDNESPSPQKEIDGVVKGQGGLKLYFDLIPKEKQISKDEIIATSALGGIFPSGLLVGVVKEVKDSGLEPFQKVEIQPAFEFEGLDKIFLIFDFNPAPKQ